MKKISISLSFLLLSVFAFGQSILIEPSKQTNISNVGDNILVESPSTFIGIQGIRFKGTISAKTPVMNTDKLFSIGAGGYYSATNKYFEKANIIFRATENWTLTATGTKMAFATTPNGEVDQVERMVINHDGNVGIGATTPTAKLQIDHSSTSSSNPHLRLRTTNDVNSAKIRTENSTGERFFEQRFYLGSASASSNYLDINYGLDNLLTITGDGKFGINNTFPSDLLHLKPISNTGDVYARLSTTTGLSGLRLQNNAGDWSMYTNEFSKLFFGYSTNNFSTNTQVLILEPNATEYNFIPSATNQVYLGTSGNRWREIWSQNALNTSSDRRLKKNIVEIKYGLDEIMKLQAVSYNWKNNNDSKLQLGFIAQDVEKIVPEIVSKSGISDEEFAKLEQKGETVSDTYGMQYTGLIPILVKAVQEQQRIIESKSLKITQLEQRLQKMEDLEARLSSMESILNSKKIIQEVKTDK